MLSLTNKTSETDMEVHLTEPLKPINDLSLPDLLKMLGHIQKLVQDKTAAQIPQYSEATLTNNKNLKMETDFTLPKKTNKR